MSGYTPSSDPAPLRRRPSRRRRCGFTRPELFELRALSRRRRPHNLRTWLVGQTAGITGSGYLRARFSEALNLASRGRLGSASTRGNRGKGIKGHFRPMSVCSYRD